MPLTCPLTQSLFLDCMAPVMGKISSRYASLCTVAFFASACDQPEAKPPAINLGSPSIAWSEKNHEQRTGFMAAAITPVIKELFVEYDDSFETEFTCETCHGENAELVDYKMPNPDLIELPAEDTLESALEDDEEVANFMMKVTGELKTMLNQGHGSDTKTNCFSCHTAEEE